MSLTADPPAKLPVDSLSLSSITTFMSCPERWRRRYLERQYEPPSGKMILGSAAGAAESQHYSHVIDTGEGFTVEQVADCFSDEWEDRISREEVNWSGEKPGELKDSGVAALEQYHLRVAPLVAPVSVERQFELAWPGLDWNVRGFMDVEDSDNTVRDLKMRGQRLSQPSADADFQPTVYLAARRAEGNPADRFMFDTMVRGRKPVAEVVSTTRSDVQLDRMTDRIFSVASEISWRAEWDVWRGPAPSFALWTVPCVRCSYWDCEWRITG